MSAVLCFPIDRQRSEVQRCAMNLHRLNGELANVNWRREMRDLATRLRRFSTPESEVSKQALAFTAAVQIELQRLSALALEASG